MRSCRTMTCTPDRAVEQAHVSSANSAWGPYPPPRSEARFLIRSIGRNGDTVESLRRSIVPTPEDERVLRSFAAQDREYGGEVLRVLNFRYKVLAEFNQLASADRNRERRAPVDGCRTCNTKVVRSCPQCGKVFKPMTETQWDRAYRVHAEVSLRHNIRVSPSTESGGAAIPGGGG